MRTTVTLDPDTEQIVRNLMRERGVSFKKAINDAIRRGASEGRSGRFETETASMGEPAVSLDRALQLAGDLEDEDLIRRMRAGA